MQEKSNKGLIWLIVILIILVVGLMSFILYKEFYADNKMSIENATNSKVEEKKQGKVEVSGNKYALDIKDYKTNKEEVYYKINNNYEVKLVFNFDDNDEYFKTYDIYVNDKFILTDENFMEPSVVYFYIIKENLVYLNTGFTDVRGKYLYLIEKNNTIHNIYQLDDITGMVPGKITLNEDNIVIEGTRLTHGISIIYDKAEMNAAMLEDSSTWAEYGITENTIIEATYTYNFDTNNKFISTPVISNETTIKEYLRNNNLN